MSSVPPVSPPSVPPQIPPAGNGEESGRKSAYAELQTWLGRLEKDVKKFSSRNLLLRGALIFGIFCFVMLLAWIHQKTIGKYAVLQDITITQNPCNQGQVEISFKVVKPGQVYCRRSWGGSYMDICDDYFEPGHYTRPWSWTYHAGEDIGISLWFRSGFLRQRATTSFPTTNELDVVFIIDTTGSMDESLRELKEKCVEFAKKVGSQDIFVRFGLIGFGDTQDGPQDDDWVVKHDFTGNIQEFQVNVANLKRFDGGDLPESALEALMEALTLSFSEKGMRRFYLVTDESFHDKMTDGISVYDVQTVGKALRENGVLLDVFCRPPFRENYRPLYGETGRYLEIENFGKILSEGRILED